MVTIRLPAARNCPRGWFLVHHLSIISLYSLCMLIFASQLWRRSNMFKYDESALDLYRRLYCTPFQVCFDRRNNKMEVESRQTAPWFLIDKTSNYMLSTWALNQAEQWQKNVWLSRGAQSCTILSNVTDYRVWRAGWSPNTSRSDDRGRSWDCYLILQHLWIRDNYTYINRWRSSRDFIM
jgi:hypothetical protein